MADEKPLRDRVQREHVIPALSDKPSGPILPSDPWHPFDSARPSKRREYAQLVVCRRCNYFRHITVQARRGGHGCIHCNGQMEVWEPRPERFGGLLGAEQQRVSPGHEEAR